ncbi:hypothetical protein PBY51_004542 [Eleginops maclovinus]|uniref:Uncharacterized protein n=2 Tax=Eleginops maclovinus TaxID=56733 RepID=A0AAN8AX49_ELEMC|nr:hypothetical protein PBY51_004542 [Eleginops maclovinus]
MDPKRPPDVSSSASVPGMGRRGGLQPQEQAIGGSRGLLLSSEGFGIGRARGFPTLGDHHRQRITPPAVNPAFGRCLPFPAAEPKVGFARGDIRPPLEHKPPGGPKMQDLALTTKEDDVAALGQRSSLVSMFRGMGISHSITSLGRAPPPGKGAGGDMGEPCPVGVISSPEGQLEPVMDGVVR